MLRAKTKVSDVAQVETLFRFIEVLVKDPEGGIAPGEKVDDEDFEEEQNLVARLVHRLRSEDSDTQYRLLVAARKQFGQGGPRRLVTTHAPARVAQEALGLGRALTRAAAADLRLGVGRGRGAGARREFARGRGGGGGGGGRAGGPALKKVLQFLHQTVAALADVGAHDVALRLFLEAAQLADTAGAEPIAYEFFERAMTVYEDEISDSQAQKTALSIIVGTLQRCVAFTPESRDSLVHKATGYSARLLKKPDQCARGGGVQPSLLGTRGCGRRGARRRLRGGVPEEVAQDCRRGAAGRR